MRYFSTRGGTAPTRLSDALAAGLAPDGGLFVPERLPTLSVADFAAAQTLPAVAATLLRPFFVGDRLAPELDAICAEAYDFDAPLRRLDATTHLLNCSTVRPPRSRITARASSPPACVDCAIRTTRR